MQENIHPQYGPCTIKCACGATTETRSTKLSEIKVEVCYKCHGFWTGKMKILDIEGRVNKFLKKYGSSYNVGGSEADASSTETAAPSA